MSESTVAASRRQPQQERSQHRVERILDAAAAVIAEVGVEAATTNAIAAKAGTSIGSIYHFFPNKDAIVVALQERYTQEMRQVSRQALAPVMSDQPLPAMMAQIVEMLATFHDHNPAYRHVYHATLDPTLPGCGDAALQQEVEGMVAELIRARSPRLTEEELAASAQLYVEMVEAALSVASLAAPERAAALKREVVRVMVLYAEDLQRQSAAREQGSD